MVNMMAIDGAGSNLGEDIREVVPLDFPVSSFDLDVEQIRQTIVGFDPVKSASVRIRPGGILQVDVEERIPAVIWRSREGLGNAGCNRCACGRCAGSAAGPSGPAADCRHRCGAGRTRGDCDCWRRPNP